MTKDHDIYRLEEMKLDEIRELNPKLHKKLLDFCSELNKKEFPETTAIANSKYNVLYGLSKMHKRLLQKKKEGEAQKRLKEAEGLIMSIRSLKHETIKGLEPQKAQEGRGIAGQIRQFKDISGDKDKGEARYTKQFVERHKLDRYKGTEKEIKTRLALLEDLRKLFSNLGFGEVGKPKNEKEGDERSNIILTFDSYNRGIINVYLTLDGPEVIMDVLSFSGSYNGQVELYNICSKLKEEIGFLTPPLLLAGKDDSGNYKIVEVKKPEGPKGPRDDGPGPKEMGFKLYYTMPRGSVIRNITTGEFFAFLERAGVGAYKLLNLDTKEIEEISTEIFERMADHSTLRLVSPPIKIWIEKRAHGRKEEEERARANEMR